jgi:hypothetical protein
VSRNGTDSFLFCALRMFSKHDQLQGNSPGSSAAGGDERNVISPHGRIAACGRDYGGWGWRWTTDPSASAATADDRDEHTHPQPFAAMAPSQNQRKRQREQRRQDDEATSGSHQETGRSGARSGRLVRVDGHSEGGRG